MSQSSSCSPGVSLGSLVSHRGEWALRSPPRKVRWPICKRTRSSVSVMPADRMGPRRCCGLWPISDEKAGPGQ